MNPWALFPLIASIAFTILIVFTIIQTKRHIHRIFTTYLVASGVWSFCAFMLTYNPNASSNYLLTWQPLVITAIPWTAVAYYHFVRHYDNKSAGIGVYLGYLFVLVVFIMGITGNVVKDAYFDGFYEVYDAGPWVLIISAVLAPFLFYATFTLVKRYLKSSDPTDRNRTMYLLSGATLLIIIAFITPLFKAIAGYPIDHLGSISNAMVISYAISRYQLLDIKGVARRGLTYIVLIGILIGIYTGTILLGLALFPGESISTIVMGATIIVILLALMTRPLRRAVENGIDRIFYRGTYEPRRELLEFRAKMGNLLKLGELAQAMLPSMSKALDISKAALMFQDSSDADFTIQYIHPDRDNSKKDEKELKLSYDSPVVEWLGKNQAPLSPGRLDGIPELKGLWQAEKDQLTASGFDMLHPIKSRDNLIGILALGEKNSGNIYNTSDIELVTSIANQTGIIIENAQLYTQATHRANTDGLTTLYNHRHFHERIEQEIARASRFGTTFSLILLDLDLFKAYNDIYGHLAGDQLLKKIGRLIQGAIRGVDLAFRYGGEEFAIILPETRLDDAFRVAERIRKSIESNSSFREMPVTASVGIASWPNDGIMKEEIVNRADTALYHAKQTGRNRTCLSTDTLKPGTPLIGAELESQPKALSIIYALAATVDAKDHYTYGHSRKVSEYAVALAEAAKLPKERIDTIRAAGLLHDIGKIGIPDQTLSKPGALNEEEWNIIKTHPELGVEILKRVIDLVNCLPAIMHHHEHYNGSGYPKGLKSTNIPLEARILSIADAYDAITSPRPYRGQLSMQQAIEELKRCAGSQFDPELVEKFRKVIQPEHRAETTKGTEAASDSKKR
jgi:diguanylate cyclase (GGDEF)-like protein/putative nucleotidyltransferase with HDIG domain